MDKSISLCLKISITLILINNWIPVHGRTPRVMIPSTSYYDNNYDQSSINHYYYQQPEAIQTTSPPQLSPISPDNPFQVVHKAPGEVKIVSKSTYTDNFVGGVSTGKNSINRLGESRRKKVDVEKFKECIFFRLCSKAQCFHYGRHNTCQ